MQIFKKRKTKLRKKSKNLLMNNSSLNNKPETSMSSKINLIMN